MENVLKAVEKRVKYWYLYSLIGILYMILGVYIFMTPIGTYLTLSILFSLSFIISGLFDIFFSINNRDSIQGWGWYLAGGIVSFILGIYLTQNFVVSMSILPFYIGFIVLFKSFMFLGISLDLKDRGSQNWKNLAIFSVISLIFSFILLSHPVFTGLSLVFLTGFCFIAIGVTKIIFSIQLKKVKNKISEL